MTRYADACLDTVRGLGFHTQEATAQVFRGWARAVEGDVEGGVAETEEGLARTEASGAMGGLVQLYLTGTDTMILTGRLERAAELLEKAEATIERTRERAAFEPQIPMFRAALLLESGAGSEEEIEALLLDSIERWHAYESSWMEVRSAMLLGRLALATGRTDAARERLARLLEGFREGFDTPRFRAAQELLERLGG